MPKTYFYTLHIPPSPAVSDPKTTFVLGVEHFRAPEVLREDRIVFYESPTELNFYQYHRWTADPATMLTDLAARWLDESGVFRRVLLMPSHEPTDYTLKGRLHSFEEVDYEGGGKGRVALKLALVRVRDGLVVWSSSRQAERPIEEKGIAGVVKALNTSSEEILRQALPGLAAQVERDFSETQQQTQPAR